MRGAVFRQPFSVRAVALCEGVPGRPQCNPRNDTSCWGSVQSQFSNLISSPKPEGRKQQSCRWHLRPSAFWLIFL